MKKQLSGFIILLLIFILSGCVSKKKYSELQAEKEKMQLGLAELRSNHQSLEAKHNNLNESHDILKEEYKALKRSKQELAQSSKTELQKINTQLENKIEQLQRSYDKIQNLETAVQAKNEALESLLGRLKNALVGFSGEELSMEIKNGKVYVSLSEELLFPSGSITVNKEGEEALEKLAGVLKKQQDLDIVVEGHTDTIPIHTSSVKDNWDLSVLRATSIVRILTEENSVDPQKIVACGRGEYFPVASNEKAENRAKNRRTEIMLSPKMEELMQMLEAQAR